MKNPRANRMRAERRAFVEDYKHQRGCIDCGEDDARCLDLDHRDPSEKILGVAEMISIGRAWDVILAEIAKCDVRCSNCHRKRHTDR